MNVSRPGTRSRVEALAQRDRVGGFDGRSELDADRVLHAGEELDVRAVELAGALADPEQVGGAVVPVAGQAVLAGQRLLVPEQQRLVRRVAVDLVELELLVEIDAAGLHEAQRALDLGGDGLVAPALGARGHEVLVPGVDAGEIGEPALGEGAQEVQRRRGLVVAPEQAARVRAPGGRLEREVVDHVAAEARELDVVARLRRGGAGLGELAGDPAELHRRDAGAVGEQHRHLQDDLELVADAVRRERAERLGAVAGLEQERLALGNARRATRSANAPRPRTRAGGGHRARSSTASSDPSAGHSGCCAAGRDRHESGDQGGSTGAGAAVIGRRR